MGGKMKINLKYFLCVFVPLAHYSPAFASTNRGTGTSSGKVIIAEKSQSSRECDGLPEGTVINGYLSEKVDEESDCIPVSKFCKNGHWFGPKVFSQCEAEP